MRKWAAGSLHHDIQLDEKNTAGQKAEREDKGRKRWGLIQAVAALVSNVADLDPMQQSHYAA